MTWDEERRELIREIAGKSFRTRDKIPGRAWEPYMKQQILDRIMTVWEANPELRLGQLLMYAEDLYTIEDFPFIEELEEFYERHKTL